MGRDWGQEEKGMTEDEMAGWHHGLNGHGFGWTPGVGDRQGNLVIQKAQGLGNDCECPGSQEPAPGTARVQVLPKLSPIPGQEGAGLGFSQTLSSHPQQSGFLQDGGSGRAK